MPERKHMDSILTLGAAIAEEAGLRTRKLGSVDHDDLYVLASALAWASLRRFWQGDGSAALHRWREDVPDAIDRYAERIGIERS
ncbi:MAG: hypothetical protein NVV74_14885 [Magnetospirillum sp.]|nr:hypothetical protein [Magnetospirillum sp.]